MGVPKDILVSVGLDLKTYEDELKRLSSSYTKLEKETSAAGKKLATAQIAVFTASAFAADTFTTALRKGGAQASELVKSFDNLDRSKYADFYDTTKANTQALKNFGGAFLQLLEYIPGVKTLESPFIASNEDIARQREIGKTISFQAASYDQLISKLGTLETLRAQSRAIGTNSGKLADEEHRFKIAMDGVSDAFSKQAKQEADAYKLSNIAVKEHVALVQVDIEKRTKLAALQASLRNPNGSMSRQATKIYAAGAELIEQEAEFKKKSLDFTIAQEEAQADLNRTISVTGNNTADRLKLEREIAGSLQKQYETAKAIYGEHALITTQLKAQAHQAGLASLEGKAAELEKSPAQRRKERQLQRRHFRKLRTAAERNRVDAETDANAASLGQEDTNRQGVQFTRPKDPRQEIAGYVQRQGQAKGTDSKAVQANTISAGTLVVGELKST